MTAIKKFLKSVAPSLYLGVHNTYYNWRFVTAEKRILIVRHPRKPEKYNIILDSVERNCPELRGLFELRTLGCRIRDWSPYILHIPWLQDPVQCWSIRAYSHAEQLASECDAHQIPIINRVDRLINACKSSGASRMTVSGIRTPRMALIENAAEFYETLLGLELPLLIREDWGHGGLVLRADTRVDVQNLPIERFKRPVAVEFIDVQSPDDGLYRKYRFVAAGDEGIPLHLQVSKEWKTKGNSMLHSESINREEQEYLKHPDPHHEQLLEARNSLGLDFVAFDYSYDQDGRLVIWEANAYPNLHFPRRRRPHRIPAVERALAAIVKLYLNRACLHVPARIEELLAFHPDSADERLDPITKALP